MAVRKKTSEPAADRSRPSEVGAAQPINVLEDLRYRIEVCELMPGDRLKFEELARHYKASVGTLREALLTLESEGTVEGIRNRGYQVAPVSVADLLDITELRVELECRALRLSIEHGDEAWEAGVVTAWHLLARIQEARADARVMDPLWSRRHMDFHAALLAACPSQRNLRFCAQLFHLAQRYQRLSVKYRAGTPSRGFSEHKGLMEMALARDADKACEFIESHIRATTQSILRAVPQFKTEAATALQSDA